jgi:peptide/nickel transport system permease protein
MTNYIMRRVLLMIPTLFVVSLMVFLVIRLLPGDVVENVIGQFASLSEGDREAVEEDLGLNDPWYEQYWEFITGAIQGDFGNSLQSRTPISEALADRVPVSIQLGLMALFIAVFVGVPLGVLAAIKQDSMIDYVTRSTAITFVALPSFWLGTLVIVLPSVWWDWAPPIQYKEFWEDPRENLVMLGIPAIILGLGLSGGIMRLTRAQVLEVMRQDYIRTASSKGLHQRTVIVRHALKNALIPVTTLIALQIPIIIGGTVVLETIFSIPGMGAYLVTAATGSDYTVIQAVNLLVAVVVLSSNLVTDIIYAYLDPRIRYS